MHGKVILLNVIVMDFIHLTCIFIIKIADYVKPFVLVCSFICWTLIFYRQTCRIVYHLAIVMIFHSLGIEDKVVNLLDSVSDMLFYNFIV